jgi:hypothetical protein
MKSSTFAEGIAPRFFNEKLSWFMNHPALCRLMEKGSRAI